MTHAGRVFPTGEAEFATVEERWMAYAVALGRRNMGATSKNPSVGCVIVDQEQNVVGVGWTDAGGRPHGEVRALEMAGERSRGATAYVSLEPCSHHGKTPPCAEALIAGGITRAVVAIEDPDVRVSGQGIMKLREAGIAVDTGVLAGRARRDLAGYLSRQARNRPLVQLKLAMSADGKIAAKPGERVRITGAECKSRVHLMRAESDGILVGVSTVLADDPDLTCKLPGLFDRSPVRIVSDSRLSIPLDCKLVKTADKVSTWLLTTHLGAPERARALRERGVVLVTCLATAEGKVDLREAMMRLAGRGLNRVMAEGGAHMARALLEADLVDEVCLFGAPHSLGGQGLDALAGLPLEHVTASARFRLRSEEVLGIDSLKEFERLREDKAMFTGLVSDIGQVTAIEKNDGLRVEITCNYNPASIEVGASIACAGVCLTVVEKRKGEDGTAAFSVDVSAETLQCSTLGKWQVGSRVNLERSLKLGDELGGHLVSGHVDAVGKIVSITPEGDSRRFRIEVSGDISRYIAPKGSISLDGTSFTVNEVEGDQFGINVIPHTLGVTTWADAKPGDGVNVEIDMLARYVARLSATAAA